MNKEELLLRTNAKLQHLLETSLDFVLLITQNDDQQFDTYRKIMLNKYNALKKANAADFYSWGRENE
ncbi:MAG: hypothetical protein H6Q72_1895 [Firmicutes bacterium]|nr:hypothetical protein [Bacillota bacterium]